MSSIITNANGRQEYLADDESLSATQTRAGLDAEETTLTEAEENGTALETRRDASAILENAKGTGKTGNLIFRGISTGAAATIALTLAAVAVFLIVQAWPALSDPDLKLRTMGSGQMVGLFGFTAPQVFGTLLGSALALGIAVPIAVSVALFISHYAPRRLAGILGYLVDLLAAVPSVVYGLWGALWLLPLLVPVNEWISKYFGWIPLFAGPVSPTGRVMGVAAIILSVMILPIITSISREVFMRTPVDHQEAALALGATRWEMVRMVVLPAGRSGVISASMLGLGRALGETMAVVMVLSVGSSFSWRILDAGQHSTIAANIALQFPEATGIETSALIATGLVLFVITLAVTMAARAIVNKSGKAK